MLFINLNLYAHTTFASISSDSESVKRNSHEYLMDVAFNVSSESAANVGDQVCVDVTVDNFTDILAAQFSVNYDSNFLEYVSVGNFGLAGLNENVMGLPSGGTNPGDITVAWTDPTFGGITVANGTVLFEICFNTLAEATTDIEVTGTPTAIQVIDVNTSILPTIQNAGTVTIGSGGSNGGGGGTDDFTFSVSSETASNVGDQVCVDVSVENFTDILGAQFSIDYDASSLEYESVGNFGLPGLNENVMGLPGGGTNAGDITVAWTDPNLGGVTVADGTVLFEICFTTLASGTSTVAVTGTPTAIQVIDSGSSIVPTVQNDGTVTVNGGGGTNDFTFDVTSATANNVGDQVCIDVTVDNFTDIIAAQFSVNYDPAIIEFASVGNFGLPGLNENVMGLPSGGTSPGEITVAWTDPTLGGVTVANGTVLFEICFTAQASGTSPVNVTGTPTSIQVIDSGNSIVPTVQSGGTVTVEGGNPPPTSDDFTLILSDEFTPISGNSVCLEVTALNFTNIVGMQFSINYNPSKLTYESVGNFGLDGLSENVMGLPGMGTQPGTITVAWTDPTLGGISVPDNSVLFEVCFTADLASGSTPVEFSDTPTAIQILDSDVNLVPADLVNGSVSIGDPNSVLILEVEDATVCSDDGEFCINVSVENFSNIVGMQFSIAYDPTDLDYNSVGNFGLDGLNENVMGLPTGGVGSTNPGVITVAWTDPTLGGVTVPDGTTIFQICFDPLGADGSSSNVEFSNTPTSIQIIDGNTTQIPFNDFTGVITFDCTQFSVPVIEEPASIVGNDCFGDNNGSISINVSGGSGDFSFLWSGGAGNTATITNLTSGNYTVTVTDNQSGQIAVQTFTVPLLGNAITINSGAVISNIQCVGETNGQIDLSPSGGTGSLQIEWEGLPNFLVTQANLSAGTYNVTITDSNGCELLESYTVEEPEEISIQPQVQDVLCAGQTNGSITLNISGGTAASDYNVTWSDNTLFGDQVVSLAGGTYDVTISDDNNCQITESIDVAIPAPLTLNPSIEDVLCAGENSGTITLNITGGTPNPSYNIDWGGPLSDNESIQTGLPANVYSVSVTDANGCSESDNIEVEEPDSPLVVTAATEGVTCEGGPTGSISLNITGGVISGDYSIDWETLPDGMMVQENLEAGVYTVSVGDDNGCVTTESYIVDSDAAIFINGEVTDVACSGENTGGISITIAGGSHSFDIAWSGEVPNPLGTQQMELSGGVYNVTVTDTQSGCEKIESFTVEEPDELTATAEIGNVNCFGDATGAILLNITGGTENYTVDWASADIPQNELMPSNLVAGTYDLTITDANGCEVSQSIDIAQGDEIIVTESITPALGLINNTNGAISLNLSGGAEPFDVQWDNGMSGAEISGLMGGTYCAIITDGNDCIIEACYEVEFVSLPFIIEELNPIEVNCSGESNGRLFITMGGGIPPYELTININGTNVMFTSLTGEFEVEGLAAGTYDISIVDGNGDLQTSQEAIVEPDPITVNVTVRHDTELTGPGSGSGRVDLQIAGGTPQYNIIWEGTALQGSPIINLNAESYIPQITDSRGCEITLDEIEVEEFAIDLEGTDALCTGDENGFIDLVIKDGDAPYTFTWTNPDGSTTVMEDLANIPAGTYEVTVTENSGNTLIESITIGTQSNLTIMADVLSDFNGFDVSCLDASDGRVSANAIFNGTDCDDCSFEWELNGNLESVDATLTDAAPGTYTIMVIDPLGCENIQEIELSAPPQMQLNANIQEASCPGEEDGVITVTVLGGVGGFFNYNWSNGAASFQNTNLASGVYALTATDANACTASTSFEVGEPIALEVSIQTEEDNDPDACNGSIWAVVNGGNPPYSYDWNAFAVDPTVSLVENVCPGSDYVVTVTDVRGCSAVVGNIIVRDGSVDCLEERIVITPDGNGSNDEFIINCIEELQDTHLEIYNRWGQLVFETDNYDNTWEGTSQNGNLLPEGPYFFVLDYRDNGSGNMTQFRGSLTILKE